MATTSSRHKGGTRPGAGQKREKEGKDVRIRISEAEHCRWNELKNIRKLPNDTAVAKYLLDLASGKMFICERTYSASIA